ncbi:MAG: type II toxin-antitoxin system RelE/ParE family toxin [Epsilonproteobacteria bacterium]|nr:type II toxin-antitoxin system RelE/ParE family toxin [Campylobacterota bacterium]
MKIIYTHIFKTELRDILIYIAQDKPSASLNFKNELKAYINEIPDNPFKYRQSFYFDDKNIRDMTFKGYTIVYEVNFKNNSIEILKIFNRNKP